MGLEGDRGGARRPRRGLEGRLIRTSGTCVILGERADHALLEPLQALFVAERAATCGLDPDRVDGHPVAGSEDAGIDDVRPRSRHRAGNGGEQADVIGRVERHLRCVPGPVDAGLDQGPPVPALHEAGVALLHRAVGGQPIGSGEPGLEVRDVGLGPVREAGTQGLPGLRHARVAVLGLAAARQNGLGAVVEHAQERSFPRGHAPRPNGGDVGGGQNQQEPETLERTDPADEIVDGARIVRVALERGHAEQEMPADQPGGGLDLVGREFQPGGDLARDLGADFRVVPAPPLRDIVQQQREIEHIAHPQLVNERAGERQLVGQGASLDRGEHADGTDAVLVDRVDVIEIELGLRHDAAEIRQKATHHAGLVHHPQDLFGIAPVGEDRAEGAVGLRVVAHRCGDQPVALVDQAQRGRMNVAAFGLRPAKDRHEAHRALAEGAFADRRDAPA